MLVLVLGSDATCARSLAALQSLCLWAPGPKADPAGGPNRPLAVDGPRSGAGLLSLLEQAGATWAVVVCSLPSAVLRLVEVAQRHTQRPQSGSRIRQLVLIVLLGSWHWRLRRVYAVRGQ